MEKQTSVASDSNNGSDDSSSSRAPGRSMLWAGGVALCLVLLYPLSYAPSVVLVDRGVLPQSSGLWLRPLYVPLDRFLQGAPEPVKKAHSRYYWWWCELLPSDDQPI